MGGVGAEHLHFTSGKTKARRDTAKTFGQSEQTSTSLAVTGVRVFHLNTVVRLPLGGKGCLPAGQGQLDLLEPPSSEVRVVGAGGRGLTIALALLPDSHPSGGPPADLCLGLHALGNWAPGQHVISGQEALSSQQGHGATGSVEAASG